ncbi:hypothetical protein UY3_11071 [Chelonia mydas]|uniref:Uncharacterized protein n=1 Tax=Chelonia mydas TaxID=8469 RepID=M7BUL4_CHEMY|nr:hypothetical protein UY3_11071 [Chelonia mydas]
MQITSSHTANLIEQDSVSHPYDVGRQEGSKPVPGMKKADTHCTGETTLLGYRRQTLEDAEKCQLETVSASPPPTSDINISDRDKPVAALGGKANMECFTGEDAAAIFPASTAASTSTVFQSYSPYVGGTATGHSLPTRAHSLHRLLNTERVLPQNTENSVF